MEFRALDGDEFLDILAEFSYIASASPSPIYRAGDRHPAIKIELKGAPPTLEVVRRELRSVANRTMRPGFKSAEVILVEMGGTTLYLFVIASTPSNSDTFSPEDFRRS